MGSSYSVNQREKVKLNALNEHYMVISFNPDGTVIDANEKFVTLSGYSLKDIVGKHHKIFCEPKYTKSEDYINFWKELNSGETKTAEFRRIKKNGESIYIHASYQPLIDENGNVFEIFKLAQDITKQKLESLNNSGQIEAINKSQAVIEFDLDGIILDANEKFLDAMDYKLEEIKGKHHSIFVESSYKNSDEYKKFWQKLREGEFDTGKYKRVGKNGKNVWIQATYTPILDIDKKPVKIIKFAQDITQFEKIKKDDLTNFYTKEKLILDIEESENCSLAIIDIDDYSYFLDFYGEDFGNKLIVEFSKILRKLFDDKFEIYRVNLAKFGILNTKYSKLEFLEILQSVLKTFKKSFLDLEVKKFHLFTTCGVSFEENKKLLSTTERVHKYAKKSSKNIVVYSKDLDIEGEFEKNILWTEKIKSALEEDRIKVFYQPIYNNKTEKIDKYEALVRLEDTDGIIHSPFFFLDVAKKSKQYLDISKVVIEKSFKKFQNNSYEFSINLTVEDICDNDLNRYLINKINEYNIGNRLVIEIVESEKITTYDTVFDFIAKVKKLGCKIAIDDFGSGYSNFEYLSKINADFVKIDGSIIKDILEDTTSLEILKSILSFCKKIDIKTIAEFISSKELQEKIESLGVDYSQGFYLGKPEENLLETADK